MIIASSRMALGLMALAALTSPATASGKGGFGSSAPPPAKAHAPSAVHKPSFVSPVRPANGGGTGYGADALRPVAPAVAPTPRNASPPVIALPLAFGFPASVPRVALAGEGDEPRYGYPYALPPLALGVPQRRIEPGSFAPVDPRAFIGETPSGRVFMGAPAGVATYAPSYRPRHTSQRSAPYAQPRFIVIGEASRKHMSGPVHVTYGVEPSRRFRPDPQVVWLRPDGAARK